MPPHPIALAATAKIALGLFQLAASEIKYFIDSTFRETVTPVSGSVLYCDLCVAAEHSGIYIEEERISNIDVDGFAKCTVRLDGPTGFTSKSWLGRKIYVSCDKHGEPVGHLLVAQGAASHVGETGFYGLIFKNCHEFSKKCVEYSDEEHSEVFFDKGADALLDVNWESTITALKTAAQKKIGATKWRLWDWDQEISRNPAPEPDWGAIADSFQKLPLDAHSIAHMRAELKNIQAHAEEIADEKIPQRIRTRLDEFQKNLSAISEKYEEAKDFLAACPGAGFSYADLQALGKDFPALAAQLQQNTHIKELARKLGRNYISEERKKQTRIPQISKSEVHGTHRSKDVMRILPSELLNLEDDTLETLFYARLLEQNLLTYELRGIAIVNSEETETHQKKRTGPVVACLDTSASMNGQPLLKAKALLRAIANILTQEKRSLHVLLFGAQGQIHEFSMAETNDAPRLLRFLQQGFGGGTDFETPLSRAMDIIDLQTDYQKADVLMISDGDCALSDSFVQDLVARKEALNCMVYLVLCAGKREANALSDEIVVL